MGLKGLLLDGLRVITVTVGWSLSPEGQGMRSQPQTEGFVSRPEDKLAGTVCVW